MLNYQGVLGFDPNPGWLKHVETIENTKKIMGCLPLRFLQDFAVGPSHGFRIRPGHHLSASAVQRPARPGAGQSGAGQGVRPDNALGTCFLEEKIIK